MYKYDGRNTYDDDSWFRGIFSFCFYEMDSEEYGITNGFTFTLLGNSFNFVKKVK